MKGPVLVVLAAGIGSRYGGLKQMDKIGKNGDNKGSIEFSDGSRGNAAYDPNTGSLSVNVLDTGGNGLTGVLACTYSKDKDRVVISGTIKGEASFIAVATLQIDGTKPLA